MPTKTSNVPFINWGHFINIWQIIRITAKPYILWKRPKKGMKVLIHWKKCSIKVAQQHLSLAQEQASRVLEPRPNVLISSANSPANIRQAIPNVDTGPPRQPRMPRIGPCQVLAATLTLSQPGGGADYANPILGSLPG